MFETINSDLSDYLKLLRFKSKKSQEEVAKGLDVSRNTYAILEYNPISLSLDILNRITNFFDNDITNFFIFSFPFSKVSSYLNNHTEII